MLLSVMDESISLNYYYICYLFICMHFQSSPLFQDFSNVQPYSQDVKGLKTQKLVAVLIPCPRMVYSGFLNQNTVMLTTQFITYSIPKAMKSGNS